MAQRVHIWQTDEFAYDKTPHDVIDAWANGFCVAQDKVNAYVQKKRDREGRERQMMSIVRRTLKFNRKKEKKDDENE